MMRESYSRKANIVLGTVFGCFAAAAVIKHQYPHSFPVRLLYSVFEAALVGGIADWFAVTALFQRPLGFGWHTALIPRNRDKLIEAIASAVQNELLSKESLKRRLAGARLVDLVIVWLGSGDRPATFQRMVARFAQDVLSGTDPQAIARYAQRLIKQYLREADFSDKIRQALKWGLESGKAEQLLNYLIAELTIIVARDSTRQAIAEYLERYKENVTNSWWQKLILDIAELTNTLNTLEAATVLQVELQQLLNDLSDVGHPLRRVVQTRLAIAIDKLENDAAWQASVATWQQGLAGRVDLAETLTTLIRLGMTDITPAGMTNWAVRQADKLWETFRTDTVLQAWVEDRLKVAMGELIDIEHNLVATVVKEALERLNDRDLSRFVEDKAGEDLAWIRINGSVVGGIVGLILFLFLHYIYNPFMVPVIRAWVQ